jgi:hypothetical protein
MGTKCKLGVPRLADAKAIKVGNGGIETDISGRVCMPEGQQGFLSFNNCRMGASLGLAGGII